MNIRVCLGDTTREPYGDDEATDDEQPARRRPTQHP